MGAKANDQCDRTTRVKMEVEYERTASEILKEIVLKAWRRCGCEATSADIVSAIKSSRKLSTRVEQQLGNRQDSGDEVWEELVPRLLRSDGQYTGIKRGDPPRKVYSIRQDLYE